jgi:hypothetical protein
VRADVMNAVANKNFFKLIGVRESVDLKLVLGRLELLKWDVKDLLAFLVKEQSSFTEPDWNLLRNSAFLPGIIYHEQTEEKKTVAPSKEATTTTTTASPTVTVTVIKQSTTTATATEGAKKQLVGEKLEVRRKAGELFLPHDMIKALGLPVLDWPDESTSSIIHLRIILIYI